MMEAFCLSCLCASLALKQGGLVPRDEWHAETESAFSSTVNLQIDRSP